MNVYPELEQLVHQKLKRLGSRYRPILRFKIVFRKMKSEERITCLASAKLNVPRTILCSSETGTTYEAAFEKLITKLEYQLQRHEEEISE
jgi:ribosomal subunit interface protein